MSVRFVRFPPYVARVDHRGPTMRLVLPRGTGYVPTLVLGVVFVGAGVYLRQVGVSYGGGWMRDGWVMMGLGALGLLIAWLQLGRREFRLDVENDLLEERAWRIYRRRFARLKDFQVGVQAVHVHLKSDGNDIRIHKPWRGYAVLIEEGPLTYGSSLPRIALATYEQVENARRLAQEIARHGGMKVVEHPEQEFIHTSRL